VHELPVDGAANSACIKFLAAILGIRKNQIEITVGQKSRVKLVQITGRLLEEVENSLLEYL